jgi:hypothetical protein
MIASIFRRTDVFVGTTANGERVLMTGELRQEGPRETIEHEKIEAPVCLSLTSAVFKGKKNTSRNHIISGATLEHLGKIVAPAPGFTLDEARELHAIGTRYHLNTLKAACVHMDMDTPECKGKDVGALLDQNIVCPETGYRWGSAWLVEPLPEEIQARFTQLMQQGATEPVDY